MSPGEQKMYVLVFGMVVIVVAAATTSFGGYWNQVVLCMPSFFAVLFGSFAFLKIGYKLSKIESHDEEH